MVLREKDLHGDEELPEVTSLKWCFDDSLKECDEYYVSDWSGSDYHHSVHTFWKKNTGKKQVLK